jgi:hypothetical protein
MGFTYNFDNSWSKKHKKMLSTVIVANVEGVDGEGTICVARYQETKL